MVSLYDDKVNYEECLLILDLMIGVIRNDQKERNKNQTVPNSSHSKQRGRLNTDKQIQHKQSRYDNQKTEV